MSATTLYYVLVLLTIGIWLVAILSFWYGRKLLHQQQRMWAQLGPYISRLQHENASVKSLAISDDTPLADLRDVRLPDNIEINFRHD